MSTPKPAIFLDRDNTIIHNDGDLGDPEQVKLIQGAASAIASLRGLGYKIVVITNQGGVARGKFTEQDVDAVNTRVNEVVRATNRAAWIDRFYYCPFHPEAVLEKYRQDHDWRKPKPGMLLQAAKELEIDLAQSWTIGDQVRDVEAGLAAGTRAVLLDPQSPQWQPLLVHPPQRSAESLDAGPAKAYLTARNLVEAVRVVAQQRKPEGDDGPALSVAEPLTSSSAAPTIARTAPARVPPRRFQPLHSPNWRETGTPDRKAPAPDVAEVVAAPLPPVSPPPPVPSPSLVPPVSAPVTYAPTAPPAPLPTPPDASAAPTASPSSDATLRQILQELRNQRSTSEDFSYTHMIAIVLQTIAAVLLLAGLLIGKEASDLLRWFGAAVILQLGALSAQLLSRRS